LVTEEGRARTSFVVLSLLLVLRCPLTAVITYASNKSSHWSNFERRLTSFRPDLRCVHLYAHCTGLIQQRMKLFGIMSFGPAFEWSPKPTTIHDLGMKLTKSSLKKVQQTHRPRLLTTIHQTLMRLA
jgi:hypothetical protein